MTIRKDGDRLGVSRSHPKSDRMSLNAEQVSGFLRGMARILVLAAREVDGQRQLPPEPRVDNEQEIIEGEWR